VPVIQSFNSVGGFAVGEEQTQFVDANANISANNVSSTGNIYASGNITATSLQTSGDTVISGELHAQSGMSVSGTVNSTGNISTSGNVVGGMFTSQLALYSNPTTITQNTTIPIGYNSTSAGPIAVQTGVQVIAVNSRWSVT